MKTLDEYGEVLTPEDVRNILQIGRKQTYDLLNEIEFCIKNDKPYPFHVVRVGRLIKISKKSFQKWLEGE